MAIDPAAWRHIDAGIERMLASLASDIVDDAQRAAPVDTGELRDSIHAQPVQGRTVRIVAAADHATYVELGTSRMNAQPFLRPAAYQRRGGG
ncbi:MAG: HK97 gp10 family phage protein [Actinomycetota bacterium]|nr:HK97 gp10 family phage protein [Actinomycetota bacterium]